MDVEIEVIKKIAPLNKAQKVGKEVSNHKHIESPIESDKVTIEDEDDDEEYEERGKKKERLSGGSKNRKKTSRNSDSKDKNLMKDRVIERKRGIRDLVTEEKWGVYERY